MSLGLSLCIGGGSAAPAYVRRGVVGFALIRSLVFTVAVTVVVTYRATVTDGRRRPSNWRGALPWAAMLYAGNVLLTSNDLAGLGLAGIVLMVAGVVGLVRNRRRGDEPPAMAN